jgi:S1-C subfamily serine protease
LPALAIAAWSAWRAVTLPLPGRFDESGIASAIVKLGIRAAPTARTAQTLGTEREGTGVVIDAAGLILTIGYLLLEAESILVVAGDGSVLPASVAAFDHATGFGLVRASLPEGTRPLELGDAAAVQELTHVLIAAHPAAGGLSHASIVSRRPFTGWWEYALERAIFTSPVRDNHSGAGLVSSDGLLLGIGSLWVGDAIGSGAALPGNMFVPIDLLHPILPDLKARGRRRGAARPWLGVYSEEVRGHVLVTQVLKDAPAALGGVRRGNVILAIGGQAIGSQSEFYRALWASGEAGIEVTLQVWRNKSVRELVVHSMDRM